MRKAILVLCLVGLLVVPAMAEVTGAGYIDYGFTRGMDDPATTLTRSYTRFDLKAKVDPCEETGKEHLRFPIVESDIVFGYHLVQERDSWRIPPCCAKP